MTRHYEPPAFEWTALGPVPVEMTDDLQDEGQKLAGCAEMYERKITLDSTLPSLALRIVHYHEWGHMILHDAGVQLPRELEEVVVQLYATSMVAREDFHAAGGVRED